MPAQVPWPTVSFPAVRPRADQPALGGDDKAVRVRSEGFGYQGLADDPVRISATTAYLGYQEVRQPGRPVIAQLWMVGIITEFAPRTPDPDNGRSTGGT